MKGGLAQSIDVNFDYTQNCLEFGFQDLTVFDGVSDPVYSWEFGDLAASTSSAQNPLFTYADAGEYTVILTVSGNSGAISDSWSDIVYIHYPEASFNFTEPCEGEPADFTDSSDPPAPYEISAWSWDFTNDGTPDSDVNPSSYTFLVSGPQKVTLVVTNELGCQDNAEENFVVHETPTADFLADPVCFGEATQFADNSSSPDGTINDWEWDFNDDQFPDDNTETPQYTFDAAGNWPVFLRIEDVHGCSDTITKLVTVHALPVASFTIEPGCPLESTVFTDLSVTDISTWEWDFDDETPVSTEQNPVHIFMQNGTYNVQLIVVDGNGCQDDTIQEVIQQKPEADFMVEDVCFGSPSNFFDASVYDENYPVNSWQWDFGDTQLSTAQDPVHTYEAHGEYEVEFIVFNTLLCSDTAYKTVLVDTLPEASFTYTPACEGLQTCFSSESIANAESIVSWDWNFGDESSSSQENPCHIYLVEGLYDVTLTVVNSDGCISVPYVESVFVSKAPAVDYTYNQVCFGDTTFFVNLTDTFGFEIAYLQWNFDDPESGNTTSAVYSPSHLFSSPGNYNVKLLVENEYGCMDSLINTITIDSIPFADFIMPDTISNGVVFEIVDLSFPNGSPIFTWYWDFGDGTSGTNINPITHAYYETDSYIVCLTVTDFNGCQNQYCDTIQVVGEPMADFDYASDVNLETFFADESEPSYSIVDWFWNFGDPATTLDTISGTSEPVWQYASEGWYSVFLEVEDTYGGVHDTTKLIYAGNAVVPDFDHYGQCIGDTTVFVDETYSPIASEFVSWYYDFGDGTDTSYVEPADTILHYYQFPGNYQVRHAASAIVNGFFMTDTITEEVGIFESPVAKIDTAGLNVCLGTTTYFHDATPAILDPVVSWVWNFDTEAGDSAFIQNPEFLYADTGVYNVTMLISTEQGCRSKDSVDAHVNLAPDFDFIIENSCVNSPTYFIPDYDSSAITITKWNWDFGDPLSQSNTSSLARPTHVYDRVDEFVITMQMEAFSCGGETIKSTLIYPIPYSQFSLEENYGGVQGRTKFTNTSIYSTSYLWDFGNGNESTVSDPVEVYEMDSTYIITLISYNEYFCADTSYAELYVFFKGLYFPTAFSPNNPNEELSRFTPKGINMTDYLVQVFDMRGNLLWESDKLDEAGSPVESWDGYYEGRLMPEGMYVWQAAAKFSDGSVWQGQSFDGGSAETNGMITLIR